jgi:hypothetical protein
MCGGLLVLVLVGGELHMPLLVGERLPVLVGVRPPLLLMQLVDISLLVVGLLDGDLPLVLVLVGIGLQMVLLLLLLHSLLQLHAMVHVSGRSLLLLMVVDIGVPLVGLLVVSVVALVVLWQLPVWARGQV